jgi:hypothetical protein
MGHPFTKTGHISQRFYSVPISIPEETSRQLLLYGAEYRRLLLFSVEIAIAFVSLLLDSEKEALPCWSDSALYSFPSLHPKGRAIAIRQSFSLLRRTVQWTIISTILLRFLRLVKTEREIMDCVVIFLKDIWLVPPMRKSI